MFSVILYIIFIYWALSTLFLNKTRHYFFQRFLFLIIIQSIGLISVIEAQSLILLGGLYLKFIWLIIFFIYIFIYIYQLVLGLIKTFPNISTMEWWEAFHEYNWASFLRSVSDNNKKIISNNEWLKNQQSKQLNYTTQWGLTIKNFIKLFLFFVFSLLLIFCWQLDLEYLLFRVDFLIYTYYLFFVLICFIFLFVISIFFKKLHLRNALLFITLATETKFVDKAAFDPSFDFMLSLEDLSEYQLYSVHVMYCKNFISHKKLQNNPHDLNLSNVSNFSRLVWNDTWWDCNIYYFSRLYNKLNKKN